jgi:hypothetical protein
MASIIARFAIFGRLFLIRAVFFADFAQIG